VKYYDEHLDAQLDERGDLEPPWVKFPCLERYTLGWRMGAGETWLCFVWAFLRRLGEQADDRRAWLRRHPPAPITWADWVADLLGLPSDDLVVAAEAMKGEQLVADDAAFSVYRARTDPALWPWQQTASETPAACARYATRDLAFWSRHHATDHFATAADVPAPWAAFARAHLERRRPDGLHPERGLELLALSLASGWPPAPWSLDLSLQSFEDSYDDDMGYADAFRLWLMSSFDDWPTWESYAATQPTVPDDWASWVQSELALPRLSH